MGKGVLLIGFLVSILLLASCTTHAGENGQENESVNLTTHITANETPILTSDSLKIASFNVQVFGLSKAGNKPVMDALCDVVDDYDIIAIQEVRDKSQESIEDLDRCLKNHKIIKSERLGRTSSKEQYLFVYKQSDDFANGIQLSKPSTYPDAGDIFEREPFMAQVSWKDKVFVLMVVHIKPTEATIEIAKLDDVINYAQEMYEIREVMLVGDLNMDGLYHDDDWTEIGDLTLRINGDADTTTSTRTIYAYDRIATNFPVENCGIDNMQEETNGNLGLIQAVSDHYPIYCEI